MWRKPRCASRHREAMDRFEIHPVGCCALPEVGAFLGRQLSPRTGIERRLRWLLLDNAAARSLGFYLFKKYLRVPGYSFHFASTCNAVSSELWKVAGGSAVPESET